MMPQDMALLRQRYVERYASACGGGGCGRTAILKRMLPLELVDELTRRSRTTRFIMVSGQCLKEILLCNK